MPNPEQRIAISMPAQELEHWNRHARVMGVPLAEWVRHVRHQVRRSLGESRVQELFRELREALEVSERAGRSITGWKFT